MNETYEEHRKERTTILNVNNNHVDIIDLSILDMSEEEWNDKLKDAWFRKAHYDTVEDLTLSKYYNYEVEEEKKNEIEWSEILPGIIYYGLLIGVLIFVIVQECNGG